MADFTKTVEIVFGAIDNTGDALASVSKGLSDLDTSVHDITAPLASLGTTLIEVEAGLLALGAAFLGVSINEASKFQEAIIAIGNEFGGTSDQIKQISEDVLVFGQSSGQSLEQIAASTHTAIDAGVDYTNAIQLLQSTEQLATVTHTEFNAATSLVANTLNAYKVGVDEAGHFSDVFFELTKSGVINLSDLGSQFTKLATSSAAVGIPFETLAAALATLTANGVQGRDLFGSLLNIISAIVDPSKQAADEAARLGISFGASALEANGLDGVLRDIVEATGGNVEKMSLLFGSLTNVKSALLLGSETGKTFQDSLTAIAGSTGGVTASFQLLENDLTRVNQNIVNNLREVLIATGGPLLDQYGDLGRALADIFKSLKIGIDAGAFDEVFAAINDFGARASVYFNQIAAALPQALEDLDFTGLIDSFGNLSTAIGRIFQGFDLTTPEGLRNALQLVIDAVTALTNVSTGLVDRWADVINAAKPLIESLVNTNTGAQQNLGSVLGLAQVYETLRPLVDAASSSFEIFGKTLSLLSNIGSIAKNFDALVAVFGALASPLGIGAVVLAIGGLLKVLGDTSLASERASIGTTGLANLMKELEAPVADAAKVLAELNTEMDKIVAAQTASVDPFTQQVSLATAWDDALVRINATLAESNQKIDEAGNVTSTLAEHVDKSVFSTKNLGITYDEAGNKVSEFGDSLTGISTKFKNSGDSAEEATKKTDAYKLKMEELASDERIAVINGTFELNIAALQAQADQAVAIINNIGDVINSTGQVLTSLFNLLANPDLSFSSLFDIQRQIELENDIRQQAAEDQHELSQVQIQTYQAQIDALRSGTPLFQVNADGVEPELRQLLFKLLQLIQVEASGSYGNFLLALGA